METADVKKKVKKVGIAFLHLNKYLVVLVLGGVIVGFLGDNSVMAHLKNRGRINELRSEIAAHKSLTKANLEQTHQMQTDRKAVERVGREMYYMKMDDEDVFVLSDGMASENASNTIAHETVE